MLLTALPRLAMDRQTVRRTDRNGFLHVASSPISKANVCPYMGREIPFWETIGLDPDRVYNLLRCPEELAKAAETANNIPLLSAHQPVFADDYPADLIVGSIGTGATFDGEYLSNSLVVQRRDAIEGIQSNRKRQLSGGYHYRADMTPGEFKGLPYDGVMRDIAFNHVALVFEGRAGPDVLVGDEKMKTRTALMISGAVAALVRPRLAADAKPIDMAPILDDVNAANIASTKGAIAARIVEAVTPHLAQDQSLDAADVEGAIDAVPAVADGDELNPTPAPTPTPSPAPAPSSAPSPAPAPAMDEATVQSRISAAVAASEQRSQAMETARGEVRPLIGEVVAQDSAAAIYKLGLDQLGVDLTGVSEDSYRGLFNATMKAQTKPAPIAQDSRGAALAAIVPNLPELVRI